MVGLILRGFLATILTSLLKTNFKATLLMPNNEINGNKLMNLKVHCWRGRVVLVERLLGAKGDI